MLNVNDIRNMFKETYANRSQVSKTPEYLEIINASFISDEDVIFGTISEKYQEMEMKWYLSQSLNVYDMGLDVPKIWLNISDENGNINSNYGWCIYSNENGNQFDKAINSILKNKDSRQSVMVYIRPDIHTAAFKNGMSDFICTYSAQLLVRDNKLHYLVNMRSNDVVFGYKNDRHWHDYVHNHALFRLRDKYPELEKGNMYWNANSLHIYKRHFHLIEKYRG